MKLEKNNLVNTKRLEFKHCRQYLGKKNMKKHNATCHAIPEFSSIDGSGLVTVHIQNPSN